MTTAQEKAWLSDIGREYTNRNALSPTQWEHMYRDRYGLTRTQMNEKFIGFLPKDIRILEVGCNIGNQLILLQRMGFRNLYGIEFQPYAVEMAKKRTAGINIVQGSVFDIPFKDGFFDLVYTSGVLIHVPFQDIGPTMDEIYRCSCCYIWGLEYYAPEYTEIKWRDNPSGLMWKANYSELYQHQFPGLQVVREEKFKYLPEHEKGNVDSMFLLEKA